MKHSQQALSRELGQLVNERAALSKRLRLGGPGDPPTQGVLELVGVVTLFERLRLHVAWQTFPSLYGRTQGFFNLQVGVGFQFL